MENRLETPLACQCVPLLPLRQTLFNIFLRMICDINYITYPQKRLLPRKLTWNLKIKQWKKRFLLVTIIFRFQPLVFGWVPENLPSARLLIGSWTSKIFHPRFPTKQLINMAAFKPLKPRAPWLQLSLESFPTPWRCVTPLLEQLIGWIWVFPKIGMGPQNGWFHP